MATKKDSKKPIAVRVHPTNVGQGDAILLEVKYDKGSPKKCLIDGGRGQKSTFSNLTTALDENNCISEAPKSTSLGGKTWKDRTYRQITLDSIVNTHPDADHHGGINALLGTGSKEIKSGEKFTVCCPIITTSAASLYKQVPKGKNEHTNGVEYSSAESDSPNLWFQKNAPGRKHSGVKDLSQRSTVEVGKSSSFQKDIDCNATSILTTVQIPGSTYNYDVVLTGDSYGMIILDTLGLKSEKDMPRKTVGIFQVPHHGSKNNSTMAQTKGEGSYLSCHTFYMEFDAHIYLISHGNHRGYDHPHSEVITGILSAAVQNKRKCKIVVTATQFESSSSKEKAKIKDNGISNWREYVDIYYFKKDIPYVTLDPNDKTVSDGLQLYSIEEENDKREKREHSIEKGSSSAILNKSEETLITEEGSSSAMPNKSEETPITEHPKSKIKSMKPKALFESYVPEDVALLQPSTALDCTVCGKQTEPTCVVTCTQCNSHAHANGKCTRYTRAAKNYLCDKCRKCTVCSELTNESGTYTAVCTKCESRAHANAETDCTPYNKANKASKNYLCAKCRTCTVCNVLTDESGTYTAVCKLCGSRAHANAETDCTPYNKANKESKKYVCKQCVS